MKQVELLVGLKIPDTTSITAFHTLKKMGYGINELKRKIYYKFYIEGDAERFIREIVKVDILVNANKNTAEINSKIQGKSAVLVKDIGEGCSMLKTLQERLGFSQIKRMEQGVLWLMDCGKDTAEKIAKDLLANEHYQEYRVL